jgi:hypothetical protein
MTAHMEQDPVALAALAVHETDTAAHPTLARETEVADLSTEVDQLSAIVQGLGGGTGVGGLIFADTDPALADPAPARPYVWMKTGMSTDPTPVPILVNVVVRV